MKRALQLPSGSMVFIPTPFIHEKRNLQQEESGLLKANITGLIRKLKKVHKKNQRLKELPVDKELILRIKDSPLKKAYPEKRKNEHCKEVRNNGLFFEQNTVPYQTYKD